MENNQINKAASAARSMANQFKNFMEVADVFIEVNNLASQHKDAVNSTEKAREDLEVAMQDLTRTKEEVVASLKNLKRYNEKAKEIQHDTLVMRDKILAEAGLQADAIRLQAKEDVHRQYVQINNDKTNHASWLNKWRDQEKKAKDAFQSAEDKYNKFLKTLGK